MLQLLLWRTIPSFFYILFYSFLSTDTFSYFNSILVISVILNPVVEAGGSASENASARQNLIEFSRYAPGSGTVISCVRSSLLWQRKSQQAFSRRPPIQSDLFMAVKFYRHDNIISRQLFKSFPVCFDWFQPGTAHHDCQETTGSHPILGEWYHPLRYVLLCWRYILCWLWWWRLRRPVDTTTEARPCWPTIPRWGCAFHFNFDLERAIR